MKGNIQVKDIEKLRKNGYRFLRKKDKEMLNIFYKKELLYSIQVKENGYLKVKDVRQNSTFDCEEIKFFLNPLDDGLGMLIAT